MARTVYDKLKCDECPVFTEFPYECMGCPNLQPVKRSSETLEALAETIRKA